MIHWDCLEWSEAKVTQLCPTFVTPWTIHTVHGILQARILEWVAFPFSRGSSQPRDRTQVYCIAGRFFTNWATREAQDTGVGSLSLLQRIFLTQESNWGLLHCRWILYQLSYRGSPLFRIVPGINYVTTSILYIDCACLVNLNFLCDIYLQNSWWGTWARDLKH